MMEWLRYLCNRPQPLPSKEQVIQWAHELGMHKGILDDACEACFAEALDDYIGICIEILTAIDQADQVAGFDAYLRKMAIDLPHGRCLLLHEHPAYMVTDYLGLDHSTPEFHAVIAKATPICARTV